MWPEHPETFSSSRLIEPSLASTAKLPDNDEITEPEIIPQLYTDNSDTSDSDTKDCDTNDSDTEGLCEMNQSAILHKSLVRTCQSIWRQRNHPSSSTEIDPHLSHVISRRCSLLLQTLLKRAHLNRRSAIKILQSFPQNFNRDLDNVPVNWQHGREPTKTIIRQAALDQGTFVKFKIRLETLFGKH